LAEAAGIPESMLVMKRKHIHGLLKELKDYKQKITHMDKPK